VIADLPTGQRTRAGKPLSEVPSEERMQILRRVVEDQGLRGQLRTGSYLTGELYVAFEYFPDAPKVKVDWAQDPLELPVVPGALASIEAKLGSVLAKIDRLPLDAISRDLRTALGTLDQTLKDAGTLVTRVDTQWVPRGRRRSRTFAARSAMPT
jgi:paraquat-inducible protein B